jgi:hypothetical protein
MESFHLLFMAPFSVRTYTSEPLPQIPGMSNLNKSDGFLCIGQAASVAVASGFIAISFPFLIIILYFLQNFYLRTSKQLRLMDLESKSPL